MSYSSVRPVGSFFFALLLVFFPAHHLLNIGVVGLPTAA